MGIEGLKWHTNVEGKLPNQCKDKEDGPTGWDQKEIMRLAESLAELEL